MKPELETKIIVKLVLLKAVTSGDYMKAQALEYKTCNRTISLLKEVGPTHFSGGKEVILSKA